MSRGRRAAAAAGALLLVALGLSAPGLWCLAREEWCLAALRGEDLDRKVSAARELGSLRSARAAPELARVIGEILEQVGRLYSNDIPDEEDFSKFEELFRAATGGDEAWKGDNLLAITTERVMLHATADSVEKVFDVLQQLAVRSPTSGEGEDSDLLSEAAWKSINSIGKAAVPSLRSLSGDDRERPLSRFVALVVWRHWDEAARTE